MIDASKIIVALDMNNEEAVVKLLHEISGEKVWVKIGMELFYSLGPKVISLAKDLGFKVFLDLKLHDIPNTVHRALLSLGKLPIDMVNIHAAGGIEMMRMASEAINLSPNPPLLIAVTQLTSTNQKQMNEEQRIPGDIVECVTHYAKLAKDAGLDGVVSSPLEVAAVKLVCGSKFLTVSPGIRPISFAANDQKRITTPSEAIKLGTDFMVIGRPITEASNPKETLLKIIQED